MDKFEWVFFVAAAAFILPGIVKWNGGSSFGGLVSAVFVIGFVWLICKFSPKKNIASKPVSTDVPKDDEPLTRED